MRSIYIRVCFMVIFFVKYSSSRAIYIYGESKQSENSRALLFKICNWILEYARMKYVLLKYHMIAYTLNK